MKSGTILRGLLRKDILMMVSNFRFLLFFIVIYGALSIFGQNASFMSGVLVVLVVIIPLNTFSYDEFYHWDRRVLTGPVSRKMVVQSKYLFFFLAILVTFLISVFFALIVENDLAEVLFSNLVMFCAVTLVIDLMLPCIIRWGAQKGRVVIIAFCGVIGAVGGLFSAFLLGSGASISVSLPGILAWDLFLPLCLLFIAALCTAVSYKISCRIYEKKEF